jgi:hypothetical protein
MKRRPSKPPESPDVVAGRLRRKWDEVEAAQRGDPLLANLDAAGKRKSDPKLEALRKARETNRETVERVEALEGKAQIERAIEQTSGRVNERPIRKALGIVLSKLAGVEPLELRLELQAAIDDALDHERQLRTEFDLIAFALESKR